MRNVPRQISRPATALRGAALVMACLGAVVLLSGCSELKFVNTTASDDKSDSRLNIVLSDITTEITTGALTKHRVLGKNAIYVPSANILLLRGVQVQQFDDKEKLKGITNATTSVIYLVDFPKADRSRNDIELMGSIEHIVPDEKDPTTRTGTLRTSHILYRNQAGRFEGQRPYVMDFSSSGKKSVRMEGQGFQVSSDMKRWEVKGGMMSNDSSQLPQARAVESVTKMNQYLAGAVRDGALPSDFQALAAPDLTAPANETPVTLPISMPNI